MNFLAPLFLLGALAIAAPIIFHLIRRTPMLQRTFSSLMFLSPSPPRLSRRSRLDKILLLLLRCLILGLVALAFARPFLRDKLPIATANTPQKISLLLVDSSASMKRPNLWPDAVARVRDLARRASPADRLEIALFDRGLRKLVTFDEWSALPPQERTAFSERRMAEATPTWFAGDLSSALIFAAEELDGLSQAHPAAVRQVVIISDLAEGSRLQNLQGFDWPRGVEVTFDTVRAKSRNNAGLHMAVEGENVSTTVAEGRPLVRVSNSAESKREQFRIAWVDSKTGASIGNPIDVHVSAGKSRVVRAPQRAATNAPASLVLTGDDEPFDNTLYIAAPELERVQVGFLGSAAENDPEDILYYLKRAFQETRHRMVSIVPVAQNAAAIIPPGMRFVIASGNLPDPQAESLRNFLEQGGSALFVIKDAGAAAALQKIVKAPRPLTDEAAGREYAMLEQIDFTHPVFAPFSEPRFSDFTKIHFWKHRRLETNALSQARLLARFDDGSPALVEAAIGTGRLLILTTGWHPADSQLALSSKFVPLLYSMLEYAGCFKEQANLLLTGSELPARGNTSALQRPDGTSLPSNAGRWILDSPGLFKLSEASSTQTIAVNLDPLESKTTPMEVEELHKLGIPVKTTVARSAAAVEKERKWTHAAELESRQKLWRWLIMAALLFVLVETWFAARLSRPVAVEA
jgi:hypothetical protein